MRTLVATLLLLPILAFAQSASIPIDSIWSPFGSSLKVTAATIQPLRTDATTGNLVAIAGQTVPLALTFRQSPIVATFPGQKATAMGVSALRVMLKTSGNGWTGSSVVEIPIAPMVVPAGKTLAVRYDAPFSGNGMLQLAAGVASIPDPAVAGPVVSGPISPAPVVQPPAPPPAPASAPVPTAVASLDGTKIPPAAGVTASDGALWTMGAPAGASSPVLRAGGRVGDGVALCVSGGGIYVQDTPAQGSLWQRWLNPGWSAHVATPAGC